MCGLRFVSQGCSRDRSRPYVWMTVRTYRWMEVLGGRGVETNGWEFRLEGFSWLFAGDFLSLRKIAENPVNDVGTHGLCVRQLIDSQYAFLGRTDRASIHVGVIQHPPSMVVYLL